ncbi:hypothetical protein CAEBREN_02412 [Caenorhabditis brenneri]|uniref:Uncharacterized protein n=1 Tax=Caenorhabditis brenneri TaxID=135651 RepID=G0M9B3_CAEBE|nr:hypothetical protein CAEBREN_02412 [Caenorhabditis brenneri]
MEKKLPFNIGSLKYGPDSITINTTEYKVSVIRHYGGDQTAKIHNDLKNDQSGVFGKNDNFLHGFLRKFKILNTHGIFNNKKSKVKYYKFLEKQIKRETSFRMENPKWKNELARILDLYEGYPRHDTPEHIKDQNKRGGFAHDFDEYGFKIFDSLRAGEPGDEQELNELKREYEKTKQLYVDTEESYILDSTGRDERLANLKTLVEKLHDDLQPYYNRKYSIPLEYTPYIQLSVNGKATEVVKYTKQLHCALRHALRFNRSDPVQIHTLTVNQELRVPPELKFKVRKLCLSGDLFLICDSLKPLIDDSSYPIEEVVVTETSDNGYHHETITTARSLDIWCPMWLPTLLRLQNKVVKIGVSDRLSVGGYIELIESWMNKKMDIGTTWTFDVRFHSTLTRLIDSIPHGNMVGATERYIPLPLTHSAVLHLSYHHKPTLYDKDRWILKMVIENV